jgi:hypothetical protein
MVRDPLRLSYPTQLLEACDVWEMFQRAIADDVWVSASGADATFRLFHRGDAVSLGRAFYRF